jgi:hypothetical protein
VEVKRSSLVTYSLDLDAGEVADGYRLIVRGISLRGENLLFDCTFVPERAEGADIWPSMNYGADVSPPGWNQGGRKGRYMSGPCRARTRTMPLNWYFLCSSRRSPVLVDQAVDDLPARDPAGHAGRLAGFM